MEGWRGARGGESRRVRERDRRPGCCGPEEHQLDFLGGKRGRGEGGASKKRWQPSREHNTAPSGILQKIAQVTDQNTIHTSIILKTYD